MNRDPEGQAATQAAMREARPADLDLFIERCMAQMGDGSADQVTHNHIRDSLEERYFNPLVQETSAVIGRIATVEEVSVPKVHQALVQQQQMYERFTTGDCNAANTA